MLKTASKLPFAFSLICFLAICCYSFETYKFNPTTQKLDDYLQRANAFGFSGQVLVAQKGKILLNESYGFANREKRKLIKDKTAFNIASLTKPFTALAILHLEQNGKLKTSDSIDRFFKDIPADKAKITIHQLLSHQAGLRRNFNSKKANRNEIVKDILKQPLASKVGEQFRYSNNGYHLLAAIIEIASKQTYSEYLTENIFKPVQMKYTGFFQDKRWLKKNIAQGYNEWTKVEPFTNWKKTWNYGSGSIVSNTTDLFNWYSALKSHKILPQKTQIKLIQKHAETRNKGVFYGYGWYLTKTKSGESLFYHGGDNYGYHSEFRWFPQKDILTIVLTNNEAFSYIDGGAIQKRIISNNLYRIVTGQKQQSPPSFDKKVSKKLDRYIGTYTFSDGAKFVVKKNAEFLNISAEGQTAINYLAGYDSKTAKKYVKANKLTTSIIKHIANGEKEKLKGMLPEKDYDFQIPFLAEEFANFEKQFGKLKTYKIQGTAAFPWNGNEYRTNVILNFEKEKTDLYLGWRNGKLFDITTETGRPFPLIMPLVPQTLTNFSTYEFIRSKPIPINFKMNGKTVSEITIKTNDKIIVAKKD